MNVVELVEAATNAKGSALELAQVLHKAPARITEWKKRRGKPSAADIAAMAQIAGLPVLITLAMVEADLEPETRPLWERALGEVEARLSPGMKSMVPERGIEPPTFSLRMSCSTD